MDPTSLTMTGVGLALVIGAIAYAIYDLVLVTFFGKSSTISQFLIATVFKAPFVSFAMGLLCGHLFAYMVPDMMPNGDWNAWRKTVWINVLCGIGVYEGLRQIATALYAKFKRP